MTPLKIGGETILSGESRNISLEVAKLYDYTDLTIPVRVIRGKEDGPTLFVSAGIHGDEINGVEIIKRLCLRPSLKRVRGTLILVPIVNVFGFINRSRYLPDRRDLNRSFPGSSTGSLAGRMATLFMEEIVEKCTHGIDLHTGAIHRGNLPQIRACLEDKETKRLAINFGVPAILDSSTPDGSLREAARRKKIPMLLYEGGEALRFDEGAVRVGLKGIINVMKSIGMLSSKVEMGTKTKSPYIALKSHWIRAPHSGTLLPKVRLGDRVKSGQVLGVVSDHFGENQEKIYAKTDGIVIGQLYLPLVNRGDAVFHVATFKNLDVVENMVVEYDEQLDA